MQNFKKGQQIHKNLLMKKTLNIMCQISVQSIKVNQAQAILN